MHWASILGLIMIFIGGLLSLYGSVQSDKETEQKLTSKIDERNNKIEELSHLNQELSNSNKELISQNIDLLRNNRNIQDGNFGLLEKNQDLLVRIDGYQKDIEQKDKIIEELERNAKIQKRNLSTIQFDGSYLDKTGGGIGVMYGTPENIAYKEFYTKHNENKWQELISICDEQIFKSPSWLTSYLFKAIGLYNIGNREEAKKLFEYVESEAPGDANYILFLANLYESIGNKTKATELRNQIPKEQHFKFGIKRN